MKKIKKGFISRNVTKFLDSRPGEADRGDPAGDRGIGTIVGEIEIGIIAAITGITSKFLTFSRFLYPESLNSNSV